MGQQIHKKRLFSSITLPIKYKLVLLILCITSVTLALFGLASVVAQIVTMRDVMVETKSILADSIAELSTAAISFSDKDSAIDILRTLRADENIETAVIYTADDDIFARYQSQPIADDIYLPRTVIPEARRFIIQNGKYMFEIFKPIYLDETRIGTLYVLSNTDRMAAQIKNSMLMILASILILLGVVIFVSAWLQKLITSPVLRLADAARGITQKADYDLRVEKGSHDEIGQLIDDFNTMLVAIQVRDAELQQHRQNLEQLVAERTEELKAKRDEALAAAKAKSEFLANMSHEIRTPMNGVIGVLSLLRDAPLTEEFKRLLDTATRSADSLLLIINDILDFSKIDAGKITFESIVFDLRELMEETSGLFIDTVNLKHLDLTCFIPPEIPCRIKGDPTRLRQILTNLLSNAVKFTDEGEVKLQLSVVNSEEDHQELLFTIEDTGIGIPEEVIGKLFDKFTQADGSTSRKYGGTGLGLSVCKQLVERQGGTIGLKSRSGFGSMFWFTLIFEIVEQSCPLIPYSKIQGKSFLVLDDNRTNCMLIEQYLRFCNAEVRSCSDAATGLKKIGKLLQGGKMPDTVLIDYNLPETNGVRLASQIRARFEANAPEMVLMATGSFSRSQLHDAGIRAVLLKPVRQQELYTVLADMPVKRVSHERVDQQSGIKNASLQGTVLLVDDEPINQRIGLAILRKFGLDADVASTGYEAVQKSAEKEYSVILMDVQMPGLSGFEATELIRNREKAEGRNRGVIIAMTANATESTKKKCFRVGMDDFFTKPMKPDVLAERLASWLKGKESETKPSKSSLPDSVAAEPGTALWSFETALGFVGGDQELFRELVGLFLDRNETMLQKIEDAINSGDTAAVRDAAHAYKGTANHFAAENVRALAFSLERMGAEGSIDKADRVYQDLRSAALALTESLERFLRNTDQDNS